MDFVCEKCGSKTRMQVQAVISAPGELAHKFSKQNLRRCGVPAIDKDTLTFIRCEAPK